jgi:hypothetical protein
MKVLILAITIYHCHTTDINCELNFKISFWSVNALHVTMYMQVSKFS